MSKVQEVLLVMENSAGRHGGRKDALSSGSKQSHVNEIDLISLNGAYCTNLVLLVQ